MDADTQLTTTTTSVLLLLLPLCRLEWVGRLLQGLPLLHGTAHCAATGSFVPSVLRSARRVPTHDCLLAADGMCAVLQRLEVYRVMMELWYVCI